MKINLDTFLNSKAWPFVEAKRILDRLKGKTPEKGFVLFETGYGPSGLPHIGTFAEVMRTTMVREAFHRISDIPTRLICFSDDMDGLRKIPGNIPGGDALIAHLDKPLTAIPDPFGEAESFGHYMNAKLRSFLDRFSFEYSFYSATDSYRSGEFDNMMLKVIEKYDAIMGIMLPTLGEERRKTYSPFMPICPETGMVLQVAIEKIDAASGTVFYRNTRGDLTEVPVTGGNCKLQWKPDFGMRWAALKVDYEMYGKDHRPNAEVYSNICRTLGGIAPVQFFYELFLDEEGGKISKSKGNSIGVEEWLHYAPLESMALFLYKAPEKAKRLHFEVIPNNVDEYLGLVKQYHEEADEAKRIANPVYHIHKGEVPKIETFGINFGLLLNLSSICNPEDKSILWGFIKRYAPLSSPEACPYLDSLTEFAVNYYHDFVKLHNDYLVPNEKQKEILSHIKGALVDAEALTAEEIQNRIYKIGMQANYENLRDYFRDLYLILLGRPQGPRLGSFFKLLGIDNAVKLIESKIAI